MPRSTARSEENHEKSERRPKGRSFSGLSAPGGAAAGGLVDLDHDRLATEGLVAGPVHRAHREDVDPFVWKEITFLKLPAASTSAGSPFTETAEPGSERPERMTSVPFTCGRERTSSGGVLSGPPAPLARP